MEIAIKQIENSAWILNEDGEMECEHEDRIVETGEVDTMRNGEHDTYEVRYYVCADPDCGAELEGNPDEDAHDAWVDSQIDEMRGK